MVSLTGIFAFDRVPDLYTLAFQPAPGEKPTALAEKYFAMPKKDGGRPLPGKSNVIKTLFQFELIKQGCKLRV